VKIMEVKIHLRYSAPFGNPGCLIIAESRRFTARNNRLTKRSSVHDGEHQLVDVIMVRKACCDITVQKACYTV
jgi:hypothetical protein